MNIPFQYVDAIERNIPVVQLAVIEVVRQSTSTTLDIVKFFVLDISKYCCITRQYTNGWRDVTFGHSQQGGNFLEKTSNWEGTDNLLKVGAISSQGCSLIPLIYY